MAKVYASLASTTVDPTQYSIGQGQLYTRRVYDFLNMTNGNTLFYKCRVFKDANLIKNPLKRRYEEYENAKSLAGSPYIGERYNVYEKLGRQIVFLDDVGGLSGFTYNEGYSDLPNSELKVNMSTALKVARHFEFRNGGSSFSDDNAFYGGSDDTDRKFKEVYSVDDINTYDGTYNISGLRNRIVEFVKDLFVNTERLTDEELLNENNKFDEKLGSKTRTVIEDLVHKCILNSKLNDVSNDDYYSFDESNVKSFYTDKNGNFITYPFGDTRQYGRAKSIDQIIGTEWFGETFSSQQSYYLDKSQKVISHTYSLYDERSDGDDHSFEQYKGDGPHDNYSEGTVITALKNANGLLGKTNELFAKGKIGSLINRFHTKAQEPNEIETAVDSKYGLSRGRNLRKKVPEYTTHNGYDNPYCRVWTSHHQYSKMTDRIRPFVTNGGLNKPISILQENFGEGLRPFKGNERLSDMSSLQDNGLPLIAPYNPLHGKTRGVGENGTIDALEGDAGQSDMVKKCMFSIENLAWKDINVNAKVDGTGNPVLTKEQQGPLGGRIMWFPPYNLKFTENVGVHWEGNNFIGRGEQVYTYTNTERSGTLNFTILVDHPSIVDKWANITESTKEKEDELLRFFAGCGELEVDNNIEIPVYKRVIEKTLKERIIYEPPVPPLKDETRLVVDPVPEVLQNFEKRFYVFFPNNLSGCDYINSPRTIEDYLFNGYNNTGGYEVNAGPENGVKGCIGKAEIVGAHRTYHYHVDNQTVNQYLRGKSDNNFDKGSFGLNDNFTGILEGNDEDHKKILRDFFQLDGYLVENIMNFKGAEEELKSLITQEVRGKYDINIEVNGFASAHGGYVSTANGKDDNNRLSNRRANYVISLLKTYNIVDPENIRFGGNKTTPVTSESVNAFDAKAGRSAEVIITFTVKNDVTPEKSNEYVDTSEYWNEDPSYVEGLEPAVVTAFATAPKPSIEYEPEYRIKEIVEYQKISDASTFDNEYLYFKKIGSSDSLIKKNIVDKVKYFDPAFHSITPEGFNARLTFLHQCTRQGPTYSVADSAFNYVDGNGKKQSNFAGNLAFGRPPVCVLRIGDFYYTKIRGIAQKDKG